MTASGICCGFLNLDAFGNVYVVVLRLLCFTCLVFNETECEAAPALAEVITLDDRSAELTAPAEARNIVK